MDRKEMWGLYGRCVNAGHTHAAEVLKEQWDTLAQLVTTEVVGGSASKLAYVADMDPTPWEELLDGKEQEADGA